MRRRAAIGQAAAEHGLGRVVRVHRQHAPAFGAAALAGTVAAVAGIIAGIMAVGGSRIWQLPVVAAATLIGAVVLYFHFGPIPRTGRRWYAVAEHGLLIWSPREDPVAIPYTEHERLRAVEPPATCSISDLRRVLRRRAPGRRWSRSRLAGLASYGLVAAVLAGFGWPLAGYAVLGLPLRTADFVAICEDGGGTGHRRAAAHTGDTHPIATFLDDGSGFAFESEATFPLGTASATEPADLAAVQLVACASAVGHAPEPLHECSYQTNPVVDQLYQGRYRLDVFEARTGRKIASSQLDGSTTENCPSLRTVPRNGPAASRKIVTEVDGTTFRQALEPLWRPGG